MQIPLSTHDLPALATGRLLVGYSGGLDSTVLLHALAHAPALRARGLLAIHVHHGLHEAADTWAARCATMCAHLDVPLRTLHVDVARDTGDGIEAAARSARHAAFAAEMAAGDVVVVAHHQDDQAETVLLRALRASGPDGLAAMRPLRPFARGWLWRPLLALPRAQLERYAQAHDLSWVEDPSNAVDDADRNFLRNRVLPLLRTRWPQAGPALATVAALQAGSVTLLAAGDADAMADARTLDPHVLRLDALRALPASRRARVLRRWTGHLGLPPLPARAIDWYEADLERGRGDRAPCFEWSGQRLQRWRGLLRAGPALAPLADDVEVAWDGRHALRLPDGGTLLLDGQPGHVTWTVRARRGGERIRLPRRAHSHLLKHVLQTLAVPPWQRAHLPILTDAAGTVLAAGDLVFDAGFDAWLRDRGLRLRWSPPDATQTANAAPMA